MGVGDGTPVGAEGHGAEAGATGEGAGRRFGPRRARSSRRSRRTAVSPHARVLDDDRLDVAAGREGHDLLALVELEVGATLVDPRVVGDQLDPVDTTRGRLHERPRRPLPEADIEKRWCRRRGVPRSGPAACRYSIDPSGAWTTTPPTRSSWTRVASRPSRGPAEGDRLESVDGEHRLVARDEQGGDIAGIGAGEELVSQLHRPGSVGPCRPRPPARARPGPCSRSSASRRRGLQLTAGRGQQGSSHQDRPERSEPTVAGGGRHRTHVGTTGPGVGTAATKPPGAAPWAAATLVFALWRSLVSAVDF